MNQTEKRSPMTGMAPKVRFITILRDILKSTIRGTPAFVAKKRRDEPMALLIRSPIPGMRPMIGSRPNLMVVPGTVNEASSN